VGPATENRGVLVHWQSSSPLPPPGAHSAWSPVNAVHSLIKVGSIVALHGILSVPTLTLYMPYLISTSLPTRKPLRKKKHVQSGSFSLGSSDHVTVCTHAHSVSSRRPCAKSSLSTPVDAATLKARKTGISRIG